MRCKSETKRQSIIDTADAVFRELGFEATSMSEIAARVGGSKATLYNYFSSKDELFVATILQFAQTHMEGVFRLLDPNQALEHSLRTFGEAFLQTICRPELVSVQRNLLAESGRSDVGRIFYAHGPQQGQELLAAFLEKCIVQGRLRPANALVAAHHLIGLLKSEILEPLLLRVHDQIDPAEIPPMVERAVEVFLLGYAPQNSPA